MKRFAAIALSCALAGPVMAKDIATVNGHTITQDEFDNFISLLLKEGAEDTPDLRDQVKQEMIVRLVAVQEAEEIGLDKTDSVAQELELARQGILVRALLSKYIDEHPINDDELKAQYDELKAAEAGKKEYKVRHILLQTEDKANELLADIKNDKISFEEAAKSESIDLSSGVEGGDLGWAANDIYVAEFAEAVEQQEKGKLSAKPVESEFGWHILEVEDVRETSFPDYDELKPQLEEMQREQQLTKYQEELMEKADVSE